MTSMEVIRKIDNRQLTREDLLQWCRETAELEFFRVCIWLCLGPKAQEKSIRALLFYLSSSEDVYNKMHRWVSPETYYQYVLKLPRPPKEADAYEVNGFRSHRELVDSTQQLVELV